MTCIFDDPKSTCPNAQDCIGYRDKLMEQTRPAIDRALKEFHDR